MEGDKTYKTIENERKMSKLGGNVEPCSVCSEKVYPIDRFVIEKLVMHKNCFKVCFTIDSGTHNANVQMLV